MNQRAKTEEMMGLMTSVNVFSLRVTSKEKTAKSILCKVCVFADDTRSYITDISTQQRDNTHAG